MREGGEIEDERGSGGCGGRRGRALGKGEGVEDGQAHVGDGDLREDGAVDELDEGVDGGLGVDGDADLGGGQVEEAAGLDDFEALVHHGGGVDGDALAHDPGGVLQRLLWGDVFEVGCGRVAEGAARGREPDLSDLGGGAAAHALMDGVVLGVDGEEGDVAVAGGGDDELAGGDEALLIGEADGLAGEHGGVGGFEAGDTDDGGDDEVDLGQGGDGDGAGGAVEDFDAGEVNGVKAGAKIGRESFRRDGDDARAPAPALVEGGIEVVAGGEGDGLVAIGEGLADGQGGVADGAGGTQDGEFLHGGYFRRSERGRRLRVEWTLVGSGVDGPQRKGAAFAAPGIETDSVV